MIKYWRRAAQGQKMYGNMYISLSKTLNVFNCNVDIKNVADTNLRLLWGANQFVPSVRAVIGTTHLHTSQRSSRPTHRSPNLWIYSCFRCATRREGRIKYIQRVCLYSVNGGEFFEKKNMERGERFIED